MTRNTLGDLPSVTNFIKGEHDNVQVVQETSLFDIFLEDEADAVVEAIQHGQKDQFVLLRGTHDVEEEVNVALVDDRESVEHDDFGICPMRFVEEVLLVRLLLLHRREDCFVVVLGKDSVAVVVQD